jgi:hypothetical protein
LHRRDAEISGLENALKFRVDAKYPENDVDIANCHYFGVKVLYIPQPGANLHDY